MQESLNNNNSNSLNKSELWSLSLRDLFYKYVRFLPWFVLSVAVALFGAYAYLRYTTPIYSTSATLVIKTEQQGGRGDKYDDIFGGGKSQNIQSEIAVIKSKGLMSRVVQKRNLQWSYFVKGKIKTINIYKLSPFYIEAFTINDSSRAFTLKIKVANENQFRVNNDNTSITFGQIFKNQFGVFRLVRTGGGLSKDYSIIYQPLASAAAAFAGAIQVAPQAAGTGILNISMQSPNPSLAADVINQLMDEYGGYTRELKKRTADSSLTFIDRRLDLFGKELDSVQDKLLRYSQENNLIDMPKQSSAYFDNISEADKAINTQQLQLNTADFIEIYLRDKKNVYSPVLVPSSLGLNDATLNSLVSEYNALQIQRQSLLDGNVPPGNPVVIEANQQIEKLRVSLLENLANIKRSYLKTISTLRENSGQSQTQLQSLPFKERGYYEIKRQVDNKLALYNILLQKREETALSRASTIENSQIIERAFIPSSPIKPKRRSIQIMAILIGLAIPALFIFAGEVLNDKVSTRFDVEKITSAPILGEVGHSYSDKALVVNRTTRSMVAEQFRIIRSNLQYIAGTSEKTTILVTSSFSGEGKSFVSINVGAVMALAGKKTIILELDIRKPKVLSGLGMTKGPGITNFLIGKASLPELIRQVPDQDNLFVLGCGPVPPNPSELLLDSKINEMFSWLQSTYDVVIIDTAPVGMVSDAQTLSKYANCTLYLVRQGHTFKKQVTLIDEFYRDNKLPSISIIINDVKMKPGYGYYGYGRYGYGYGYGYGSYYEEEHPPKNMLERVVDRIDPGNWFSKKKEL
ncbi:MAG TPA: polysaccharide biosynthesis tyrosine autokinase [Chitinophagaceae bacterium]|nr:polysaccharide biosynthesis tyrosine autokinase [Chitinophagaceae bacterium]